MGQDEVERHQLGLDRESRPRSAVAIVLVPDCAVARSGEDVVRLGSIRIGRRADLAQCLRASKEGLFDLASVAGEGLVLAA